MINIKKKYYGFTYTELLVNIVIINAVFITLAYIHYQIEQDFDYETNKSEMINYCNHTLDLLSNELIRCVEYDLDPNPGSSYNLNITYNDSDNDGISERRKFYINLNTGLYEVINNGQLVPLDNPYNPRDGVNRLKYEITLFDINEPDILIWSPNANAARRSSCNIVMEIDLYDNMCDVNSENCNKIETLRFHRTIFLPLNYLM